MTPTHLRLTITTVRDFYTIDEFRAYVLYMATQGVQIPADKLLRGCKWELTTAAKGEFVKTVYEVTQ